MSVEKMDPADKRSRLLYPLLILLLIGLVVLSATLGRYPISAGELIQILTNRFITKNEASIGENIVFNVRIPRILTSVFIGAALSVAGASYQSIFKNPMVSPDLLGVTSGAGFGASLALLLRMSFWKVQLAAFFFGLLAVFITLTIGRITDKGAGGKTTLLILAGMIAGTLFKSLISVIKYLADPADALPEITFWLMGSISGVNGTDFLKIALPIVPGILPLILLRWKLNAMACGDDEARALGIETEKIRRIIILSSTVATSASISICGIIGWIGLIIPHITRMITGPDNRHLIPLSVILGGIYLLLIDNLSRTLFPVEIPLGILTSIIGTPFFLYLLINARRNWE